MIAAGLEADVACVDPRKLPERFAGRAFDAALLAELPPASIPAARTASSTPSPARGPMFLRPSRLALGEIVTRDGFVFCDLTPAAGVSEASHAAEGRCALSA